MGITDLEVSEVGFGVWTLSTRKWGRIAESQAASLLLEAYDLGVTFFDTSDAYSEGYGEEILAKTLRDQRHEIIIGTKVGYDFYSSTYEEELKDYGQNFTPEYIRSACEKSLRRLKTDYIDLYQLHNPQTDIIEKDDVFEILEDLIKEGKVRYYGFSLEQNIVQPDLGKAAMRDRKANALQIIYSILDPYPARDLFLTAQEERTGLIARESDSPTRLGSSYKTDATLNTTKKTSQSYACGSAVDIENSAQLDFLEKHLDSSRRQLAVKFALSAPMISSVLPNITNISQLQELAATSETGNIPKDLLARLFELFEKDCS